MTNYLALVSVFAILAGACNKNDTGTTGKLAPTQVSIDEPTTEVPTKTPTTQVPTQTPMTVVSTEAPSTGMDKPTIHSLCLAPLSKSEVVMDNAIYHAIKKYYRKYNVDDFRRSTDQSDSEVINEAINCLKKIAYKDDSVSTGNIYPGTNSVLGHIELDFSPRIYSISSPINLTNLRLGLIGNGATLKAVQEIPHFISTSSVDSVENVVAKSVSVVARRNAAIEAAENLEDSTEEQKTIKADALKRALSMRQEIDVFPNTPILIRDMVLDGNGLSNYGIRSLAWGSIFENIEIKNNKLDGISMEMNREFVGTCVNNQFISLRIYDNGRHGIHLKDPARNKLTDIHIKNSIFKNNGGYGIQASNSAGYHFSKLFFDQNSFGSILIDSGGYATILEHIYSKDSTSLIVQNIYLPTIATQISDSVIMGRVVHQGQVLNRKEALCLRSINNIYTGQAARLAHHNTNCTYLSQGDQYDHQTPFTGTTSGKISLSESKICDQLKNGDIPFIQSSLFPASNLKCTDTSLNFPVISEADILSLKPSIPSVHNIWVEDFRQDQSNNTPNDDETIAAAISAASLKSGLVTINFESGRIYKITRPVLIRQANSEISINGNGSTIYCASVSDSALSISGLNKVYLNDVTIYGNGLCKTGIKSSSSLDSYNTKVYKASVNGIKIDFTYNATGVFSAHLPYILKNHSDGIVVLNKVANKIDIQSGFIFHNGRYENESKQWVTTGGMGINIQNGSNAKIKGIHFYSNDGGSIKFDRAADTEQNPSVEYIYSEDKRGVSTHWISNSAMTIKNSVFKGYNEHFGKAGDSSTSLCMRSVGNAYFNNNSYIHLNSINRNCKITSKYDHFRSKDPFRYSDSITKIEGVSTIGTWWSCSSLKEGQTVRGGLFENQTILRSSNLMKASSEVPLIAATDAAGNSINPAILYTCE